MSVGCSCSRQQDKDDARCKDNWLLINENYWNGWTFELKSLSKQISLPDEEFIMHRVSAGGRRTNSPTDFEFRIHAVGGIDVADEHLFANYSDYRLIDH